MVHHLSSLVLALVLVVATACSRASKPADTGSSSGGPSAGSGAVGGSAAGGSADPRATPPGADAECPTEDCGPPLGLRSKICPDGVSTEGPTGRCLRRADGTCGWEIGKCP